MSVREITIDEFSNLFEVNPTAFDTAAFARLNASKAERVTAYAGINDRGEAVIGQIFGQKEGMLCAPFSAPFSLPTIKGEADTTEFYNEVARKARRDIKLVWTPECYDLADAPVSATAIKDFSYHYPTSRFAEYERYLSRSGRYNHNRALKHNFEFFRTDDIERAYSIIKANREAMGYGLAMSLEQVLETIKIIEAHFFILTLDGDDAAAAMLYRVTPSIVQNIYWGDLPQSRHARAMNHLAWRVFGWYAERMPQVKIIDVGPASTEGVLNEGLSQFKLSVGCIETVKPTILISGNP